MDSALFVFIRVHSWPICLRGRALSIEFGRKLARKVQRPRAARSADVRGCSVARPPRVLLASVSMRKPRLLTAALILCAPLHGQVITTLAGTDWIFPSGARPAVDSPLGDLRGVLVDRNGALYISDRDNHMVLRVAANGILTVFAGNGLAGTTGD